MRTGYIVSTLCMTVTLSIAQNIVPAKEKPAKAITLPQGEMSSEEATVRNTYAKLSYAAQLGVLVNAVIYNGQRYSTTSGPVASDAVDIERTLADQINFELTDFHVGDVVAIKDKQLFTLASLPLTDSFKLTNESLNYSIGSQFSTTNTTAFWASVRWKTNAETVQDNKERADEIGQLNVRQLLARVSAKYPRFATFSVRATLHGRSVSYQALFLFPKNLKEGDLWPIDMVVGSELVMFSKTPLYPGVFLETAFRELPTVQTWVDGHTISTCPAKGVRAVCCDPQRGVCGVDHDDLQKAMNIPVDPATREVLRKGRAQ